MVSDRVDSRVSDAIRKAVKAGRCRAAAKAHPGAAALYEACARRWSFEATAVCNLIAREPE